MAVRDEKKKLIAAFLEEGWGGWMREAGGRKEITRLGVLLRFNICSSLGLMR